MKQREFSVIIAVLFCAGSLFVAPLYGQTQDSSYSDDWKFFGNIYLWGAAIEGHSVDGGKIDVAFSDLFDNLHFAAKGGLGAKRASGVL